MLIAITRTPGPELEKCELTHIERRPIEFSRALAQHQVYRDALRDAGAHVIKLPADPALPDGVFVEDTAVVLDEVAVIGSLAPLSRRAETVAMEAILRPFRPLVRVPAGACLEGGDVLRIGRTLYVGQSARTNDAGLQALQNIVHPLRYTVVPVRVRGCLHLKSACSALDDESLLANRAWVDAESLSDHRLVDIPAEEPWGANVLRLPGTILVSAAYPRTADLVRSLGHAALALDVSELHKAEAGLTCMSIVFESQT